MGTHDLARGDAVLAEHRVMRLNLILAPARVDEGLLLPRQAHLREHLANPRPVHALSDEVIDRLMRLVQRELALGNCPAAKLHLVS